MELSRWGRGRVTVPTENTQRTQPKPWKPTNRLKETFRNVKKNIGGGGGQEVGGKRGKEEENQKSQERRNYCRREPSSCSWGFALGVTRYRPFSRSHFSSWCVCNWVHVCVCVSMCVFTDLSIRSCSSLVRLSNLFPILNWNCAKMSRPKTYWSRLSIEPIYP